MNKFEVFEAENVSAFDEYELSISHRLNYDNNRLTAVWPTNATTDNYIVAVVAVEENQFSLYEDAAVLDVDGDSALCLINKAAYGSGK